MGCRFPLLARPRPIGHVIAPNALVFSPCLMNWGKDGFPGNYHVEHYRSRAGGGTGTIIVEATIVDPRAMTNPRQLGLWDDRFIDPLTEITGAIRDQGSVALVQLSHGGPRAPSDINGCQPIAASATGQVSREAARAAEPAEIDHIIEQFCWAAVRAQKAGFHGVEFHAGHFYLLGTFLSPMTNVRTDDYGGDAAGRARILLDIIARTRRETGPEFVIGARINGCELLPGGQTVDDSVTVVRLMKAAGADFVDVSAYAAPVSQRHTSVLEVGSTPGASCPAGMFLPYAHHIRQHTQIPVIAVGKITDPELAESALASGQADFIGLARPLFRDPDFGRKAFHGQEDLILLCTWCGRCLDEMGYPPPSCRLLARKGC